MVSTNGMTQMAKYRVDYFNETNDAQPARSEVIDASDESAAADAVVGRMQSDEKRADVTPVDGGETFTLDRSTLSGGAKLN